MAGKHCGSFDTGRRRKLSTVPGASNHEITAQGDWQRSYVAACAPPRICNIEVGGESFNSALSGPGEGAPSSDRGTSARYKWILSYCLLV